MYIDIKYHIYAVHNHSLLALEIPGLKVEPFFQADATTAEAVDSLGQSYSGYMENSDSLTGRFVVLPSEVGKVSTRGWGSLWTPNDGFPPSYIAVGDIPEDERPPNESQMGRTGFVQAKRISYEATGANAATAFVQSYRANIFGIAASNSRPPVSDGDYFERQEFLDDVDAHEEQCHWRFDGTHNCQSDDAVQGAYEEYGFPSLPW